MKMPSLCFGTTGRALRSYQVLLAASAMLMATSTAVLAQQPQQQVDPNAEIRITPAKLQALLAAARLQAVSDFGQVQGQAQGVGREIEEQLKTSTPPAPK